MRDMGGSHIYNIYIDPPCPAPPKIINFETNYWLYLLPRNSRRKMINDDEFMIINDDDLMMYVLFVV